MHRFHAVLITVTCVTLGAACAATTHVNLAPGAAHVRLTKTPGDVSACKPVGNIKVPIELNANAESRFRDQVVGLGGNAGFVTVGTLRAPAEGIAYQCP